MNNVKIFQKMNSNIFSLWKWEGAVKESLRVPVLQMQSTF